MGGSQEQMKIQTAPLMTDLQARFLESYLGGIGNIMEGFKFGEGYPGAKSAGYNPKIFSLGGGWAGAGAWAGVGPGPEAGPGPEVGPLGPTGPTGPAGATGPGPDVTVIPGPTPGVEPGAQVMPYNPRLTPTPFSPIPFILDSIGKPTQPLSNENQLMQILTSPFISPFRYAQTGNYPKSKA